MKINQLLIFLIFPLQIFAQLNENFSDGDLRMNPEWVGDTSSFTVDAAGRLQSQGASVTETIYLSTASTRLADTEWKFFVRLEFNPSSGNYAKFYLCSDSADLNGALNGYYLKIGGLSGNSDAIDLYRQEGISSMKILSGKPGHAGKNLNTISIRVVRDLSGRWTLFSDTLGGTNFIQEGFCVDSTLKTSAFAGLVCHHSSTRGTKFFFDDILIRQAPLSSYKVIVAQETGLTVIFNKPLQSSSAINPADFTITGTGNPTSIFFDPATPDRVILRFSEKFNTGNYSLDIRNIVAASGETIGAGTTIPFSYTKPLLYGALVIDEIFADPSPSVALPAEEFIELYNRSADTIQLLNFSFSDGSTSASLPSLKLAPSAFLILCSSSFVSAFSSYGNTAGLSSWPSLNNTGDSLVLKDAGGKIIHAVAYSDDWYRNTVKKEGGWSLEMIDPDNLCAESENWTASENDQGGTPGKINSVNARMPDLKPPVLLKAEALDSVTALIIFNEKLDSIQYKNASVILSPAITINQISLGSDQRSIMLKADDELQPKILYSLTIENLADCSGNLLEQSSVALAVPEPASAEDLIINEVLFNPRPGGADFVEIYNRSEKYIDLGPWEIANTEKGLIANRHAISSEHLIIAPHAYFFLSVDPDMIKSQYPNAERKNGIKLASLPSYNDDEGSVILLFEGKEAQRFDYQDNYHFKLLTDQEGVSLERISSEGKGSTPAEWHSAA
ncbi:MAG: lamin tail domain-containing protein, partial [Cytophagaceae bacterium]